TEADWQRVLDVNLKGTFLGMKYAIPVIRKSGGGSIINISSIAALVGLADRAVYSASKGGIISMSRAAAMDHVSENIRINCIAPGTVDTPWIERITQTYANPAEAKKSMMDRQPHGRLVSPDEIAAMAVYLASDESKSTIGTVMVVDGGMTAK
ncbi:MAG: SDR family oxidoreductase, partial [Ignavibacteriaceae bacterium]|nr:SDR family oxidoreductase [Ignavibacteriaceae bacterium]